MTHWAEAEQDDMAKLMGEAHRPAPADGSLVGTSGDGSLCHGGASDTSSGVDDIGPIDCGAGITSADNFVT
jgi:hypothetical protein